MSKEQFLSKAGKGANVFLAAGGLVSVLVFFYIYNRQGSTGQIPLMVVPLVTAGLFFASLRLNPIHRINIVILGLSLAICGYGAEAYLYFSNPMPYEPRRPITAIEGAPKWKKQRAKTFAKQFGVDFDTRDRAEVVTALRNRGIDAVPFVSTSNNLFRKGPDGVVRMAVKVGDEDIVPLSGIANKMTVLCNESGEFVTYRSDMYGFNNPQSVWKSTAIEIAALGDSFTQGYCVPPDKNFVATIRNRYPATLNLGIAGDGPLLMLATLKEYLTPLKPKVVLWFYFEDNDLRDLQSNEKQNLILLRYLEGSFVQDLRGRQSKIDKALMNYVDQVQRKRKPPPNKESSGLNVRHLSEFFKLSSLRARSRWLIFSEEEDVDAISEANMVLFRQILAQAKNQVNAWGGRIYFVYLPGWDRYARKVPGIYGQQRAKVLDYVKGLGISLIDIHPAFQSQADPLSLYPLREPNHYNEKGHKIVADEVLKALRIPDSAAASAARPGY